MQLYKGKGEVRSDNQIRTSISLNTSTRRWFKDKGANLTLTLRMLLRHVVMRYNDGSWTADGINKMFEKDVKGDKDLLNIRIEKERIDFLREKLGIYNLSLVARVLLKGYIDLYESELLSNEDNNKELDIDKIL